MVGQIDQFSPSEAPALSMGVEMDFMFLALECLRAFDGERCVRLFLC